MTDAVAEQVAELQGRALDVAERATQPPSFEHVRRILNDVGISGARRRLVEAPDLVANARLSVREAQDRQKLAQAAYDEAVTEVEWTIGATCFDAKGKVLVARPDGTPLPEEEQRPMLADEKKAWVRAQAALSPEVKPLIPLLSAADRDLASARDDLAVAELRLSVAKHDVDAAAAELRFLALALPA